MVSYAQDSACKQQSSVFVNRFFHEQSLTQGGSGISGVDTVSLSQFLDFLFRGTDYKHMHIPKKQLSKLLTAFSESQLEHILNESMSISKYSWGGLRASHLYTMFQGRFKARKTRREVTLTHADGHSYTAVIDHQNIPNVWDASVQFHYKRNGSMLYAQIVGNVDEYGYSQINSTYGVERVKFGDIKEHWVQKDRKEGYIHLIVDILCDPITKNVATATDEFMFFESNRGTPLFQLKDRLGIESLEMKKHNLLSVFDNAIFAQYICSYHAGRSPFLGT